MRRGWLMAALLAGACTPQPISRRGIETRAMGPGPTGLVRAASSHTHEPSWAQAGGIRTGGGYGFVGRGSALTRDEAKRAAVRDLYANLSMFAGAQVSASSVDRDQDDGPSSYSEKIEVTGSATWRGVVPQTTYWERFESPFVPKAGRVDYLVYAEVPTEKIMAARDGQRARRRRAGGARIRVVLPFSLTSTTSSAQLGDVMQSELTGRLADRAWRVIPAHAVRDALRELPDVQSVRLERVDEVFSPDEVVSGLLDIQGDEVSADLVRYDMSAGKAQYLGRVYGVLDQPRVMAQDILRRMQRPSSTPMASEPPYAQQAASRQLRARHLLRSGDAEGALKAVYETLALTPTAEAYTLVGRILDRMGRYARATPLPKPPARATRHTEIISCSPEAKAAQKTAQSKLHSIEQDFARPGAEGWWTGRTAKLSKLTRQLLRHIDGWTVCGIGQMRCVDSCMPYEAYCPDIEGDSRLEGEWAHIYGATISRPAGVPIRLGPHESHSILPESMYTPGSAKPVRVERYEGSGHWRLISGQPRGWARRMDLETSAASPLPLPSRPDSGAEAYAAAFELARRAQDRRGEAQAVLGFADVALRVDRRATALRLFRAVRALGKRRGDLDLQSRAALGSAQALRALQRNEEAKADLQTALRLRLLVGDKTRLLEIYTELGALAIEQGDDGAAGEALYNAVRLARSLGNSYLEVVVANNLGVLELRRGHFAFAQVRFHRALDQLRDLGEAQGTIAAAINLAHTQAQVGERELAQGLLDEAEGHAKDSAQLRWLAEVSAHRGTQPSTPRQEAFVQLYFAAETYQRLGLGASLFRMQDALLVRELEDQSTAECVHRAYWRLGAPVFDVAEGQRPRPLLHKIPPGDVAPVDVVAAYHASLAYLQSDAVLKDIPARYASTRGPRVLHFPDPNRPQPPMRGATLLSGPSVDRIIQVSAGSSFSGGAPPAPKPIEYKPRVEFDRILTTLAVRAEALGTFTPRALTPSVGGWRSLNTLKVRHIARILEGVDRHAQALKMSQLRAYALVGRAGLAWIQWHSDEAYRLLLQARTLFARLSDTRGLALTDEWLGFMLAQSDNSKDALQHYQRARSLYLQLGDEAAVARVAEYGVH